MTFFKSLFILFLFSQYSFAQSDSLKNQVYLLQMGSSFKGNVRSVELSDQQRHHDEHSSPYFFRSKNITFLNQKGYITEGKVWDENNQLQSHVVYIYDTNQTTYLGKEVIYARSVKRDLPYAMPTAYYWQNSTTQLSIDERKDRILSKMEYYPSEIRKKLTCYGSDTSVIDRIDLYDSLGNRISKESWAYNIHTLEKWTYLYDQGGKILEQCTVGNEGKCVYRTINTYNDLNQKIKSESISIYDHRVEEYTYNEHGDITEMKLQRSEEDWSGSNTYVYEYDQQGNWVSCVRYWKGKDVYQAERTFTYY